MIGFCDLQNNCLQIKWFDRWAWKSGFCLPQTRSYTVSVKGKLTFLSNLVLEKLWTSILDSWKFQGLRLELCFETLEACQEIIKGFWGTFETKFQTFESWKQRTFCTFESKYKLLITANLLIFNTEVFLHLKCLFSILNPSQNIWIEVHVLQLSVFKDCGKHSHFDCISYSTGLVGKKKSQQFFWSMSRCSGSRKY